jgi:hypothetical protein
MDTVRVIVQNSLCSVENLENYVKRPRGSRGSGRVLDLFKF